jgi:hypothetical protein
MAARVLAWLDARHEPAPPALAARMRDALKQAPAADGAAPADALLIAGEALLARLLNDGRTSREAALDLLAADALITYAFEAAAEDATPLADRARRAMVQIAALAAG